MAYSKALFLLGLIPLWLLISSQASARELPESTTAAIQETKKTEEENGLHGYDHGGYGYAIRGYGGYGGYGRHHPPEEEEKDVNPEGYGYGGYGHGGYGGYGGYGYGHGRYGGYGHRGYRHGGYGRRYPPEEEDGTN